jgi:hypothetical protein
LEEHQHKEGLRRQYLLGTLSEDERARLEESYLSDDDAFEEMETTETELVDAYVRDELSPSERALLKTRLLTSPKLLEKAKFARTLEKSLTRRSNQAVISSLQPATAVSTDRSKPFWKRIFSRFFSVPPRTFGVALASCAVLLLAFGALLLVQWLRLRDQAQQLAAARAAIEEQKRSFGQESSSDRARAEQLSAELDKERAQVEKLHADLRAKEQQRESGEQSRSSTIVAITLFTGSLRGGPGNDLKVTPGTKTIQLKLSLEADDYPRYSVSIKNAAGVEVVHRKGLRPRAVASGPTLVILVSTKELVPGQYDVRVSGLMPSGSSETIGNYQFRLSTTQK